MREGNVFSLSVHRGVCPLLPMTSGGCSGTTGGMPPTTNDTWWMDLELQRGMPPTTNDTWCMDLELQGGGHVPQLLMTPSG